MDNGKKVKKIKKMQMPAEKYLIETLKSFLFEYHKKNDDMPQILNIGAGKSILIEKRLNDSGNSFQCDRVEIEDRKVSGYGIRNCFRCSVDSMSPVETENYDVVFANFVLEHIRNLDKCVSEVYRVLKPGGIFVASVPNPAAPEFLVVKITPLWFHRIITGEDVWETYYAFQNIDELKAVFQKNSFSNIDVYYNSCILSYLDRFIILNQLARLYDGILNKLKIKRLMDNVCIVFQKS